MQSPGSQSCREREAVSDLNLGVSRVQMCGSLKTLPLQGCNPGDRFAAFPLPPPHLFPLTGIIIQAGICNPSVWEPLIYCMYTYIIIFTHLNQYELHVSKELYDYLHTPKGDLGLGCLNMCPHLARQTSLEPKEVWRAVCDMDWKFCSKARLCQP